MKKSISNGLAAAVFAGLIVLAAPVVSFAETSTLTLNIQARAPKVPTGKVRILLELSSAPDPAGEITVDNGTGPSAPFLGFPAGGSTPNGDDILITRQPATNTLTIFYTPQSRFAAPGNWCVLGALPEAQTVMISYTGSAHINSYRISSYTVPKNTAADAGTCAQAFRRVKSLAPVLNVTNMSGGAAVSKGRLPLDIILVLDKSGSMSGFASGGVGPTKWEGLKSALGIFTGLWEAAEVDVLSGSGTDLAQDRIGLVYFDSVVTPASFGGSGIFITRSGPVGPTHSWQDILDDVNTKSPGGGTAMGPGFQTGIDAFQLNPDAWKNDATVVLMTDGIQNVPPLVTLTGSNWQLDPDGAGPAPLKNLFEYGLPALTVYFGVPDVATSDMLNGIAKQMAGTSSIAGTAVEMDNSFSNQLVSALKGNTLSLLTRNENTLPAGVPASAPLPFLLDGSVRRAVITLSWPANLRAGLDLQFIPPGSTTPVAPVVTQNGPTWTVQGVDIPASGPIGDWKVRVVRRSTAGGDGPTPAIPYHLSIYSVEGKLDYQLTFPTLVAGTGDALVLAADVSYEGHPLDKLPANAITLKIDRPLVGPGTVLHDNEVSGDVLGSEISPGDVTTEYDRKVAALEKAGKLNAIRPQELNDNFLLKDNGSAVNGDKTADDAVYSARFGDTSRPGLYRFKVTLDWDDPRTGRIHRSEVIERVVEVNSDPAASLVVLTGKAAGSYDVKVTPKDRFNNFYGPSNVNPIKVTLRGGGTVTSVSDPRQTGDYVIHVDGVPAGANPHITIDVGGRQIRDDDFSHIPGFNPQNPPGNFKRWGLSLHAGLSIPHGDFNTFYNPGPNFGFDLEYRITPTFSLEGIYGFHRFNGDTFGPFTLSDVTLHQLSANGKVYGGSSPIRPFFNFGGGAYVFTPGGNTHGGLNVGGGFQFDVAPNVAIDTMYNFHNVFTSGSSTQFSTVQGGVRFRF